MILASLRDIEAEEPNVPYFDQIKHNYHDLKKKIQGKGALALDISAVSFKPQTQISSPSSVSFSKDFLFDRRFPTEPNEEVLAKSTHRSQKDIGHASEAFQNEIAILKQQL